MSDKFYSYSDNDNEINVEHRMGVTLIKIGVSDVVIPPSELPNMIAVLKSHLEEPTDDRPWYIINANYDLIGPFTSESKAQSNNRTDDVVIQATPPRPGIDHESAVEWAKDTSSGSNNDSDKNLARAYLELSAKQ